MLFIFSAIQPAIHGTWILTSELSFHECPDALMIGDRKISVMNECYGFDFDIVGTASFTSNGKIIEFSDISLTSNYETFLNKKDSAFEFNVKNDTLVLISLKTGVIEKWARMDK